MFSFLLHVKPMESRFLNFLEMMNESVILLSGYLLLLFTNVISSPYLRYNIGYVYAGVICLGVFLNCLLVTSVVLTDCFTSIKLRCQKKSNIRNLERKR